MFFPGCRLTWSTVPGAVPVLVGHIAIRVLWYWTARVELGSLLFMDRRTYLSFSGAAVPGLMAAHGFNEALEDRVPALKRVLSHYAEDGKIYNGKVRDRIDLGDKYFLFASDRISAFDVILGLVPCKGEILNRLSEFWFEQSADIVENHVIERVGGRGLLCKKAEVLPVEVIVRGYLTGSAWRDYQAGKDISGIRLPPGLKKDQAFAQPIITPSTKEAVGSHDIPISSGDIVAKGIVGAELWAQVEKAALGLFRRGQEICARQGLILVDTKYEFGLVDGRLVVVDEIHTPDSSRFWYADTYAELFGAGAEQRKLDKEYLRTWLLEQGWSGHGPAPEIPLAVYQELGWRYVQAFQEISGQEFEVMAPNPEAEAAEILSVL